MFKSSAYFVVEILVISPVGDYLHMSLKAVNVNRCQHIQKVRFYSTHERVFYTEVTTN